MMERYEEWFMDRLGYWTLNKTDSFEKTEDEIKENTEELNK